MIDRDELNDFVSAAIGQFRAGEIAEIRLKAQLAIAGFNATQIEDAYRDNLEVHRAAVDQREAARDRKFVSGLPT